MDIPIYVALAIGYVVYRITTGATYDLSTPVYRNSGSVAEVVNDVPVGSNIFLDKQQDAYMAIVHQLGLR